MPVPLEIEHRIHHVLQYTIPKAGAAEVAKKLSDIGIRGIWNFAHVDLNVPRGIQVENVHLSDSLMKLAYNINQFENGG